MSFYLSISFSFICRIMIKWYLALLILQFSYCLSLCPDECACNIDNENRLQITCRTYFFYIFFCLPYIQFILREISARCTHLQHQLMFNQFPFRLFDLIENIGGLRKIPAKELDPNVQVLVINNSKNPLTLSPIFISFKRLQVLHINDAHIQAIGMHTFWGVQNLRVLGKHMLECYVVHTFHPNSYHLSFR